MTDGLQAPSSGVRFAAAPPLFPTKEPGPAAFFTSKVATADERSRVVGLTRGDSMTETYPLQPSDAEREDESIFEQEPPENHEHGDCDFCSRRKASA